MCCGCVGIIAIDGSEPEQTHRLARGHTPPNVCHLQTPRRPLRAGSRADPTPAEEGRCTGRPESSTL